MTDADAAIPRDPDVSRDGLQAVNALEPRQAHDAFHACCGSARWASAMASARPYRSAQAVLDRADEAFAGLQRDDWLQAFAAHAEIGAPRAADAQGAGEQATVADAGAPLRSALQTGNARYRERFGHVFVIAASGRRAEEMLVALNERLGNSPEQELDNAAAAQREITMLRLHALLNLR